MICKDKIKQIKIIINTHFITQILSLHANQTRTVKGNRSYEGNVLKAKLWRNSTLGYRVYLVVSMSDVLQYVIEVV